MNETYQSIGPETPWLFAIIGAGMISWVLIDRAIRQHKSERFYTPLAMGVWYIAAGLFALPLSLAFVGTIVIPALLAFFVKEDRLPQYVRILYSVFCAGLAVTFVLIFSNQKITLSDEDFQATPVGLFSSSEVEVENVDVPRTGMHVIAVSTKQGRWKHLRQSYGWTVSKAKGSSSFFSGGQFFWGPKGLIWGDDLGKHIADWAATTPKYSTK